MTHLPAGDVGTCDDDTDGTGDWCDGGGGGVVRKALADRGCAVWALIRDPDPEDEQAVRKQFERAHTDAEFHTVVEIRFESAPGTIPARLADLKKGQDSIVDVLNPIEDTVDPRTYGDFMNDPTERLADSDGVGYLHAYRSNEQTRQRQSTLDVADFVWRLVPVESHGEINYILKIPKTNGLDLSAKDRCLGIQVGQDVDIDRTRNIG